MSVPSWRLPSFDNSIRESVQDVMKKFKHQKESEAHQNEKQSEARQIFRQWQVGHQPKSFLPQAVNPDEKTAPRIEHPGSTAIIYCSDRAMANGFSYANSHKWANLGQGTPEAGPIPDAPPSPDSISMPDDSLEHAPTTGIKALREAVANLYNHTYRQGKYSQYTFENVCIVPGGRVGLSRVAAVVSDGYCSYQIPDHTSYQVLSAFQRHVPVPRVLDPRAKYRLDIEQIEKDIRTQGLAVIIASNPQNPTGQVISGQDLKEFVSLSMQGITLILDELYSWYIYPENERDFGRSISSAQYVDDVNVDSVVIIDGLTKNWRLPGSRVCWVIGPKDLITALSQSEPFLDGGANHSMQLAAIPLLEPSRVSMEKVALQKYFKVKRDYVLKRLHDIHLDVDIPPQATFYIWLNLERLPPPLNDGLTFFEELLKEEAIVIPGIFFDINPAHRRDPFNSPCHHFVRLSFGPPLEDLDKGIDAMEKILRAAKNKGTGKFGHSYKKALEAAAEHV